MKKFLAFLAFALCPFVAQAQSVQQSGIITPGHAACWAITGVIFDCGAPGGGVSVVGSTTTNDFVAFNASGSLIDSGINPANTSNISGLWNFNGGATAPTRAAGDNTTNVATTAFVNAGAFPNNCVILTSPLGQCINTLQGSVGGSTSIATNLNTIAIIENIGVTGPNTFLDGVAISDNVSAGGFGGRQSLQVLLNLNGWTPNGQNPFAVAGAFGVNVTVSAPGGLIFGLGSEVITQNNITATEIASQENDVALGSGSTVSYLSGFKVVQITGHAVHASILEAGIAFSNSAANVGWNYLIFAGAFPAGALNPSSCLTGSCTVGTYIYGDTSLRLWRGLDLASVNGSSGAGAFAIVTPGFGVDWSSNVLIGGTVFAAKTITQAGSSSGTVVLQTQAAAGTWNWNWPITAGTSGQCLASAAGGSSPMTWGGCATSASPTFTGTVTMPDASTWTSTLLTGNTATFGGLFRLTYGTPTIASGACGTGANGSVSGNNQNGLVTIGAAGTATCTISFSTTLTNAPNACVIFPANATAAATGTTVARVSSISTGNFVITGTTLASSNYYYICI